MSIKKHFKVNSINGNIFIWFVYPHEILTIIQKVLKSNIEDRSFIIVIILTLVLSHQRDKLVYRVKANVLMLSLIYVIILLDYNNNFPVQNFSVYLQFSCPFIGYSTKQHFADAVKPGHKKRPRDRLKVVI